MDSNGSCSLLFFLEGASAIKVSKYNLHIAVRTDHSLQTAFAINVSNPVPARAVHCLASDLSTNVYGKVIHFHPSPPT